MTLTDGSTTTTAPLHPGQRALWFLHEIEPGEVAYNTCTAITLRGPLRLAALRRAIRQVGRRHDSLRTVFLEEDGEPRQVAAGEAVGPHLVDLTGLAEPDREVEVGRQLGRLAAIPFDLRGGPPVRWALLRCGAEHHVLLLDVHHIVFDRDSLAAIGRELEQDYTGAVRPERHASDVRLALKAWTADHHQGEAFWQRTLDGAPASSSPFAPGTARGDGPVRQRIELDHAALFVPTTGAGGHAPHLGDHGLQIQLLVDAQKQQQHRQSQPQCPRPHLDAHPIEVAFPAEKRQHPGQRHQGNARDRAAARPGETVAVHPPAQQ